MTIDLAAVVGSVGYWAAMGVLLIGVITAMVVLSVADRRRRMRHDDLDEDVARALNSSEEYERERSELRRVI